MTDFTKYVFGFCENPPELCENGVDFIIIGTEKEYWKNKGCLDDRGIDYHILDEIGDASGLVLGELMESHWEVSSKNGEVIDRQSVRAKLEKIGMIYCPEMGDGK